MKTSTIASEVFLLCALGALACEKTQAPAEDASTANQQEAEASATSDSLTSKPLETPAATSDSYFVEGVAGGVMVDTLELQAEVVAVDQEARTAVLRGPQGNQITVRVGKDAVNFYQVAPGDRVNVAMARELVVYVPEEDEEQTPDTTAEAVRGAEEGQAPGGAMVSTTQVTATIEELDDGARTAQLGFEDGTSQTFQVRPDVDMSKYEAGQKVVFLITEYLALEVEKI